MLLKEAVELGREVDQLLKNIENKKEFDFTSSNVRIKMAKVICSIVYGIDFDDVQQRYSELKLGEFIREIDSPTDLREVLLESAEHKNIKQLLYSNELEISLVTYFKAYIMRMTRQQMEELYCILAGVDKAKLPDTVHKWAAFKQGVRKGKIHLKDDVLPHVKKHYMKFFSRCQYCV